MLIFKILKTAFSGILSLPGRIIPGGGRAEDLFRLIKYSLGKRLPSGSRQRNSAGGVSEPGLEENCGDPGSVDETTVFVFREIFLNWKKVLLFISVLLIIASLFLLLILPGYKCTTGSKSFEKSPVEIPGMK